MVSLPQSIFMSSSFCSTNPIELESSLLQLESPLCVEIGGVKSKWYNVEPVKKIIHPVTSIVKQKLKPDATHLESQPLENWSRGNHSCRSVWAREFQGWWSYGGKLSLKTATWYSSTSTAPRLTASCHFLKARAFYLHSLPFLAPQMGSLCGSIFVLQGLCIIASLHLFSEALPRSSLHPHSPH